jgi:hypothetical protein
MAGLILLLLLMSALPASRLCPRLPTRGGLAAALFSAAFFIQTLDGQPDTYFQTCPAALVWAGLLTLILIWTLVAVFRKLGRSRPIAAVAGLLLLYAASGPVMALVGHFSGSELTWASLNASPDSLTGALPSGMWMTWPMALTLGLGLPLAALLSLGDQWSSLRRPGARHGGNFFLALAWLGLLLSGILLFNPGAEAYSDLVKKVRDLVPLQTEAVPAATVQWPAALMPSATAPEPTAPEAAEPAQAAPQDADEPPLAAVSEPEAPLSPNPDTPPLVPADAPGTLPISELQRRVEDMETQLRNLSDRLTRLEKPDQPVAPPSE